MLNNAAFVGSGVSLCTKSIVVHVDCAATFAKQIFTTTEEAAME